MKTLLFLFALSVSGTLIAQQDSIARARAMCSKYVVQKFDNVSGEKTAEIRTPIRVAKGREALTFDLIKRPEGRMVDCIITVQGSGPCIDDDSKVNVLFADGTRKELENDASFSCDGYMFMFIGAEDANTESYFCTKTIKTIRVWTSNGYAQVDIPPAKATALMNTFSCLMNWEFE